MSEFVQDGDAAVASAAAPAAAEWPVRFGGSGSEYFRIWIVNLLLTLLTLGLYYPFAKVRRLRYFHGVTEVGGQPMSFHADPWKMLRGYLLVTAMLGAYALAGHFSPTAGLVALVIVALIWPALWHSSLRFRLANTGWRGLRLRYTGTRGQAYAVMAVPLVVAVLGLMAMLLLPQPGPTSPEPGAAPEVPPLSFWSALLTLVPLLLSMLLMPLFLWLLKRQQHTHYALGREHTGFDAGLGRFYGLFAKSFILSIGVALLVGLPAMLLVILLGSLGNGDETSAVRRLLPMVGAAVFYLLITALAGGYWTARLQNLVWNRTHTRHLRFDSRLKARALGWLWLRNAVFILLTLGLYFPFARIASARLRLESVTVTSTLDPDALAADAATLDESAAGDAAGDLLGFDIGL